MTGLRVLVIGHSGQLARSLVGAGMARAIKIETAGRPSLDLNEVQHARTWLRERLMQTDRPQVVINTAAFTGVDAAEAQAAEARRMNTDAPRVIADVCAEFDRPMIHVSTDYVFSGRAVRPWSEIDQPAPVSVYGRTKLDGERSVAQACQKHLIVRTSWLFSAFAPNFMTTILRLARDRNEISIVDDQVGTPTPAAALADTLLTMAEHAASGDAPWGVYHYAGDTVMSWATFAAHILAAAGLTDRTIRPIPGSDYPSIAARPAWSALDSSRVREIFGCAPADFNAGLAAAINRHRADG
ncbi:hypothetical protein AWH62_01280 [Maricaulis sp. W15]|uniref:dTDP-4-dehydrorhamnose reductase n=1 Tax=Maricaulis sp. W15 TaxID=1772333 RepID=UPI00094904AB|nr:dTDP-4-dehydrorhamnose reductase [Maricaulis sp. W15]OLF81332.1 hypothetical protein AWH62_01280 [Maricaulis sp. W15]